MYFSVHGFNQIEVAKINDELGLEVKLKRNPDWKPNTDDIKLSNGETRKRADIKLPKIGNDELLILRWFANFFPSDKMIKYSINDEIYGVVKYQAILDDYPILDINKESIKRIFDNLVDFKILKHETVKKFSGTYAVYATGENYNRLIEKSANVKNNDCTVVKNNDCTVVKNNDCTVVKNNETKYNNTINYNTNNKNTTLDEFNNSLENKTNTSKKTFVNDYQKNLENEREQKNKSKRVQRITKDMKFENEILNYTTNLDVVNKLKDYLEFRKQENLTMKNWQLILTNFFKKFGDKTTSQQLEQIDYCFRKSYRDLDYENNFSGNIKISYGSYDEKYKPRCPDNCADHDTSDQPRWKDMTPEALEEYKEKNWSKKVY